MFPSFGMQNPLLNVVIQLWEREKGCRKINQPRNHMYVDFFGRWWMLIDLSYMNEKQSKELIDFIQSEHRTMLYFKYGLESYLVSTLHAVLMNGKTMNLQNGLMVGFVYHSLSVHVSGCNYPSWRRMNLLSH